MARNYDPKGIIITWGDITIKDYVDGSFLTIDNIGEGFSRVQGAGGTVDRVNNNTTSYDVVFNIMRTSPVNTLLAKIHEQDKLGLGGIYPLQIKNLENNEVILSANEAWIMDFPSGDFGKEVGTSEWTLNTGEATYRPYGNEV